MVSLKLIFALASIPLSAAAGTRGAQMAISHDASLKETEGPKKVQTRNQRKAAESKKAKKIEEKAKKIVRDFVECVNGDNDGEGPGDCTKDFREKAQVELYGYHWIHGKDKITGHTQTIKNKDEVENFWENIDNVKLSYTPTQLDFVMVDPARPGEMKIQIDLKRNERDSSVLFVIKYEESEEKCEVERQIIVDKELQDAQKMAEYHQTIETNVRNRVRVMEEEIRREEEEEEEQRKKEEREQREKEAKSLGEQKIADKNEKEKETEVSGPDGAVGGQVEGGKELTIAEKLEKIAIDERRYELRRLKELDMIRNPERYEEGKRKYVTNRTAGITTKDRREPH